MYQTTQATARLQACAAAPVLDRSLVAHLPIFEGLAPGQVDDVLRCAQPIRYARGIDVFQQDEDAHSFFLLLNGHLRVSRLTPDGQQVVVRFVAAGEIFGIALALGHANYPTTTSAVVDSVVLSWPSAVWPRLSASHPRLVANMLRIVGGRLQDAHTRIVEMSTEQVERRIAHALLRLAHQAGRKVNGGIRIDFPISRQDVAEMTGATLHTVSRVLSAWEEKGLVEGGRQKITLRDPHRIFMLAEAASR